MAAMSPQFPPGWYTDAQGVRRWWSGRDWTTYTQPVSASMPAQHVSGLTTGGHIANAILTVCTLGLWAPIWVLMWWLGRRRIR